MCLPLCLVLSFAPIFSSGNGMAEEDHSDGIADGYKDVDSVVRVSDSTGIAKLVAKAITTIYSDTSLSAIYED